MKNKLKETGGFTLVELIVVIAILGILAGVGGVAYAGYVERANKGVDIQLAGDIKYALALAGMDSSTELGDGVGVVIQETGVTYKKIDAGNWVADDEEDSAAKAAVCAAFGDDSTLKLSYDGWTNAAGTVYAQYSQSSFYGTEQALMKDIQQLTDAFEDFTEFNNDGLAAYAGDNFMDFLSENGIDQSDKQKVANSATLYVADRTVNVDEEAYVNVWADMNSIAGDFGELETGEISLGTMGGLASLYARGEALVKYLDQQKKADGVQTTVEVGGVEYGSLSDWFSQQKVEGTDVSAVSQSVQNLYIATSGLAISSDYYNDTMEYFGMTSPTDPINPDSQAATDAKAYLQTMKALKEASPILLDNLDNNTLYTDVGTVQLVTGYISLGGVLEGISGSAIGVVAVRQEDGSYQVSSYPIDYLS